MWTKLTVGSEIAAYWEEYQNYYPCKLIERGAKPGWFRAEYDSGEIEWHDMKAMKFRWQQDPIEEEFAEDHEDDCSEQYEDEVDTHNSNTEPDDDDDLDADLLEEEEQQQPLTKKGRGSQAKASTTRSTGTRGDRGRKRSDTSNDNGKSSRSTKRTKTEDVDDDQRNNGNNDDDTQNEGHNLIEKSILLQTPKRVMTMSLQSQKKGPLLRSVNNKIDSKSNDSALDDKGNGTRDEEDDQGSELLSNDDDDDDDDDNDEDYVHKESDEEDDEEDEEYCDDEGVIEKVKKGKKKSAIKKVVNKKPTKAGVTKPILNIVEEGNVRTGDRTVLNEGSKSQEIESNQKKAHVKSESGCDDADDNGDNDGKSIEYNSSMSIEYNSSINIKKETTPKKLIIMDDNYVVSKSGMQSRLNNKQVKKAHDNKELTKADALLCIMVNFHMSGLKEVAFKKVYTDLGFKPNNKAINIAWKKLGEEEYVEEVKNKKEKVFQLTAKGMVRAAPDDYVHQLANPPTTTQELHRRIKSNAVNEYGAQTFELLLENGSMTTKELAEKIGNTGTSGHKFFYGFRQLKLLGYVIKDPNNNLSWSLSPEKAFVK